MTSDEYLGFEIHVEKYFVDAFRVRGVPWSAEKRQALYARFRAVDLVAAKEAVTQEFSRHPDEESPNWNRVVGSLPAKREADVVRGWQDEIDREKARFRTRWSALDAKGREQARVLALAMLPEVFRETVEQDPHRDARWRAYCSAAMDVMDGVHIPLSSSERFRERLVVMHRNHETMLANMELRLDRKFPYKEPFTHAGRAEVNA